ncbi:unnamed protein product, partial [Effrenium voratum]
GSIASACCDSLALATLQQHEESLSRPNSCPSLTIEPSTSTRQIQHLRKVNGGLFSDAPSWQRDTATAPLLPSRHRCLSRSIWSNAVGCYEMFPEVSEAKSSYVDHKPKRFGPAKCFVSHPDAFSIHREESFKFGNKQMMRMGARPNAPSEKAAHG